MAKNKGQKSTKKGGKGAKSKTAGSGYDPTPFYKNVPDDYKAVQKVKKAIEVRGRPIELTYDPDAKEGSVVVEDIKGAVHKIAIRTALMFDTIMFFLGEYNNLPKFRQGDKAYRTNMIKRALTYQPRVPLLFRHTKVGSEQVLFGVMSNKWRPVAAEDYIDTVKNVLKELDVKASISHTESDGLHGGQIVVEPKDNDGIIQPIATFDFGRWDGYNRVRGVAGGQVLACSNQLTIDVRGAMGQLEIGAFAALSELHVGEDMKFETLVTKVAEAIGAYGTIVDAAKKVGLKKDKMEMVVQYYTDKNVISARTQAKLLEAMKSEEIQQVPDTMFGLAMGMSYVGTHDTDLKDGVRGALKTLAGEILVVSQDPKGYWKHIKAHHDKRQTKEKVEQKATKKAAKKEAKAKKGKGKSKK